MRNKSDGRLFLLIGLMLTVSAAAAARKDPGGTAYRYAEEAAIAATIDLDNPDPAQLRSIFAARRMRVINAIPDGAMLVFSVDRAQERRLEFQVPHSDNHDFIYLTGLDGLESLDSALLLVPAAVDAAGRLDEPPRDRVVLFTSGDPVALTRRTGIDDVRPFAELEHELSVAMTDFRDWRITQVRRWPLAAALSRAWGENKKVLYLNYPRFFRLGEPEPSRLETFARLQRFSPELEVRDSADILDRIRMRHDSWSLANLRRAVDITGDGIVEALRAARAGMSETEVMEIMDFVYRYHGATLGFPTSVRRQPAIGASEGPAIPEGWIEFVPRSGGAALQPGDMVWTDTGAAFNHYSADIQRNAPLDGSFTEEQRRLYTIALDVQKTVIGMVRPGVTWWELHDKAIAMLRAAGGYDADYYYGIGHFVGMEVHDEGDYNIPLQPGMVLSIEQGVMKPGEARIAFEDDVLVTEDGHDWLSRSIPIEIDEIEKMQATPGDFERFVEKRADQITR
jgi:Xaa-Pro aminopeptidase